MHELHSYVWAYTDEFKKLGIEVEENVKLLNSTNPNIETIRKSIVPTQFCQVKNNTGFSTDFGVFEIGHVIDGVDENNMCKEYKKLAITLFSKTKSLEKLYFELRDMIAVIVEDIRHKGLSYEKMEATHSYQHPKNLNKILCDGVAIGEIGVAHPVVSKKIDKKANVVYAEIDINDFAGITNAGISYEEPSKYPSMEVDLSFVADKYEMIGKAIEAANSSLIKKVFVTDTYEDENGKSITVRIIFIRNKR